MEKILLLMVSMVLLLNIGLVFAHETNFAETKQLIDSGISCDKLTDEQLEEMGDYYMEQMHPGEAHEIMDKMMGGEGSESLKQTHIQMAKGIYCNEDINGMMSGGMMNMMMGNNMMGSGGMMGMMNTGGSNMMGSGMMGNFGYGFWYWNFINILYVILLVGVIVLVYLGIMKLWRGLSNKSSK